MTGPLTGALKIPVVTSLPCQATSRGKPTFTDKIFMIRRLMAQLGILTLENYRERMQFGGHHTCHNGRIGFHKFLRSGFVTGLKNRNSKRFITRLSCASGKNQLTRLNRSLEIGEMPIDGCLVLSCPRLVVVQTRHEM